MKTLATVMILSCSMVVSGLMASESRISPKHNGEENLPLQVPSGGAADGKYALLVGIEDYPGEDSDLPNVSKDVDAVARMLKNKFGYLDSEILIIRDHNATRDNIVRAIQGFLGQAGPSGHGFFYYSGHGTQTETNLAVQAPLDPENDNHDEAVVLYDSLLLDDEVGYLLRELDAGSISVLFDSCYSGTAARGVKGNAKFLERDRYSKFVSMPDTYLTDAWSPPSSTSSLSGAFAGALKLDPRVTFIAASAEDEVSWVDGGLKMSLMTHNVVTQFPKSTGIDIKQYMSHWSPIVSAYALSNYDEPQTINAEWTGAPMAISKIVKGTNEKK